MKEYDPIADYIFSLPKWDGKDRLDDLVRRIPTDCHDVRLYLHTWLLSMVAHWLDDAETKALMLHNMKYRELTDLSEMVDCAFAIPTDDEGEYLTSYELIDYLAQQNKDLSRSNNLNVELGKVMRAKGFEYKHRNKGVVYKVKRVNLPYK